jgi:hypothetical protein
MENRCRLDAKVDAQVAVNNRCVNATRPKIPQIIRQLGDFPARQAATEVARAFQPVTIVRRFVRIVQSHDDSCPNPFNH